MAALSILCRFAAWRVEAPLVGVSLLAGSLLEYLVIGKALVTSAIGRTTPCRVYCLWLGQCQFILTSSLNTPAKWI